MNMLTREQEQVLESNGFLASDESFLYAGSNDVVRGDVVNLEVSSLENGSSFYSTTEDFFDALLSFVEDK